MKKQQTEWETELASKLYDLADSFGFQLSRTRNTNNSFADFIIKVDEANMIGFNLNVALAVKPFKLFPQGIDMGLDEIEEFFEEIARNKDLQAMGIFPGGEDENA